MGIVVVISGPRDCGKRHLIQAMRRDIPDLDRRIRIVPMYNSRQPHYYEKEGEFWLFRQIRQIEQMASEGRIIASPMRQGNMIGVDPQMITEAAMEKDAIVLVRVAAAIGAQMAGHPDLKHTALRSVFLSPISRKDIESFRASGADNPDKLKNAILEFMKARIRPSVYMARRMEQDVATYMDNGINDFFEDLGFAHSFTHVLVNPEIMGGDHWLAEIMPEESAKVFRSFVAILRGERPEHSEVWPHDLILGSSREERIRADFRPRRFT